MLIGWGAILTILLAREVSGTGDNITYGEDTVLTFNTVWEGTVYLNAQVFVKSGATLTIKAGTEIICYYTPAEPIHTPQNPNQAHTATSEAAALLMVERGARILAVGTIDAPITFRSAEVSVTNPAAREAGTWGGVVILGNAPTNGCDESTVAEYMGQSSIEAVSNPLADPRYGGTNVEDNSGILTYVRIWFGGAQASSNQEINGLTLGGVGRGTTIHHLEVAYNLDDGLELFGGTVDLSYISLLYNRDDQLDIDCGYQGHIQWLFITQAVGYGEHAYEIDSHDDCTTVGCAVQPRTRPIISQATILGPGTSQSECQSLGEDDDLISLSHGAAGVFVNTIMAYAPHAGTLSNTDLTVETGTSYSEEELFAKYYYYQIEDQSGLAGGTEIVSWDDVCMPVPCTATTDLSQTTEKFGPGLAQLGGLDFDILAGLQPAEYPGAFAPGEPSWLIGWSLLDSYNKLDTTTVCQVPSLGTVDAAARRGMAGMVTLLGLAVAALVSVI